MHIWRTELGPDALDFQPVRHPYRTHINNNNEL